MRKSSSVSWLCEKCDALNELSQDYFLDTGCESGQVVIATCKACHRDFAVTVEGSLVR